MKKRYIYLLFLCFIPTLADAKKSVFTLWGYEEMDNPLLEEVFSSPTMVRLDGIDQSGPTAYFGLVPNFSRRDHCNGVWALLKRAHVSVEEQVAGLLHDASHTVFSHLADFLFKHDEVIHHGCYQDSIHEWFLDTMKIPTITKKFGISLHMLNPDNPSYTALERPLPDLCADRIQYNIHTGVVFHHINQQEASEIVNDLHFEQNRWFFETPKLAKKFAQLSVTFTKHVWGAEYNYAFYQVFVQILEKALAEKLITKDEMHFGTDKEVLKKVQKSTNPKIKELLKQCENIYAHFTVVEFGKGDFNFKPKFRGVNPLVRIKKNTFKTLTEIDAEFKKEFELTKNWCQNGYGIIIKKTTCS
jgi:HD superfamily phosphohydrolase